MSNLTDEERLKVEYDVGYYRGYKEGKLDGGYEERQRIIAAASFTVKLDGNRVIVDSHDWANLWRELGEK